MIKEVLQWNNERDLLNHYQPTLEFNMLLEEVLELKLKDKKDIKDLIYSINQTIDKICVSEVSEVSIKDMVDAYIDTCIIAIGSLAKLINMINKSFGKDVNIDDIEKIIKAGFYEVIQANNKKPKEKDKNGKIIKGNDFVEPIIPLTLDEVDNQHIKPMIQDYYNQFSKIDKNVKVLKDNDGDYRFIFDNKYRVFLSDSLIENLSVDIKCIFKKLDEKYDFLINSLDMVITYDFYSFLELNKSLGWVDITSQFKELK